MKKLIAITITVILLIVGVMGFSYQYNSKQEEKQKEQYSKRLAETSFNLYTEFVLSSVIVSTYSDVWSKAIDNNRDFNLALKNYQDNLTQNGLLSDREKAQDKLRNNMKLLQNPPKEYKESYAILKQMYGTYTKMTDQALSPTGSLIQFNRYTGELASQFEQQNEELEITLPADVKKITKEIEKDKKETEN